MAVKERLSREAIVSSAIALADAEGLDAVTIRRLAQDHGVTPMALYWHFKDKELLLDGVVERLMAEVELPRDDPAAPWHERFEALLQAILAVLRRHPELADLVPVRILGSEPGLVISERAFALLREAGFPRGQLAQVGVHALNTMVLLVRMEPGEGLPSEDREAVAQRVRTKQATLKALSPDRYPNIIDCADVMVDRPANERGYFELGMELLMRGIRGIAPAVSG